MKERRLVAIVPAWNESGAIGRVVGEIREFDSAIDVVVIDDASTDDTAKVAESHGATVLSLPFNVGIGGAVQTGFRYALEHGYELAVRLDGDGQHDPQDIPKELEALEREPCEMVIGSRFVDGSQGQTSFVRTVGIHFFRAIMRPILGRPVRDPTSGYVWVNRNALALFSRSFPLEYPEIEALVVLQRKRFRFVEVPCRMRPRQAGRSTITALNSLYYIAHVLLGVMVNVLKFEGRRK